VIALAPATRASGAVDITVTNRFGTSATSSADRFTYLGGFARSARFLLRGALRLIR